MNKRTEGLMEIEQTFSRGSCSGIYSSGASAIQRRRQSAFSDAASPMKLGTYAPYQGDDSNPGAQTMRTFVFAAALLLIGGSTGFAQNNKIGDIEVAHPWATATNGTQQNSIAVYMSLTDHGTAPDQLISASSPISQKVQLRVFNVDNGVYGLHRINAIEVTPDASPVLLRPGSARIQLEGLKEPLRAGKAFPLSLTFNHAGQIPVEVQVESPRMAMGQSALRNAFDPAAIHGGLQ
jgi:periplasmic copper chaperone A